MSQVTDRNAQLVRWLARIFPPSSPRYSQPAELDEKIQLFSPVLPPSLLYERTGYQVGVTLNPATELFFPSTTGLESFGATQAPVPFGKFYYIIAARFAQTGAISTTAGRAFIGMRPTTSNNELGMAQGNFGSSFLDFVDLHSPDLTVTGVMAGGGGGPFVVPPGYVVHFSTAAVPAAATTYTAQIHYCVCDIGELHP